LEDLLGDVLVGWSDGWSDGWLDGLWEFWLVFWSGKVLDFEKAFQLND
jgi:hypothetical protein